LESGIGVTNASLDSYLLYDVVDDAGREGFVLVGHEYWPSFAVADVVAEV